MPDYSNIVIKVVGPVTLVKPAANEVVNRDEIELLYDDLRRYVDDQQPERVVLTLKQISKYSSEAIGGLIRLARHIRKFGGEIKLSMSDDIREVFQVTNLEGNVFEIFSTESDAIASFFEHGGDLF